MNYTVLECKIAETLATIVAETLGEPNTDLISSDLTVYEENAGMIEVTYSLILKSKDYSPRSANRYVTLELPSKDAEADDDFKTELRRKIVYSLDIERLSTELNIDLRHPSR